MITKQHILTMLVITILSVLAPVAFAEVKIAVVNAQSAIFQSEEAKRLLAQLDTEFRADQDKVQAIQTELTAIQEKFQKDAEVMSDAEKRRLEQDFETKNSDLTYEVKKLQRRIDERRTELFSGIDTKLQKAIDELVLQDDYDIILRHQAVLYRGELYDISGKVTEKLNQLDKK